AARKSTPPAMFVATSGRGLGIVRFVAIDDEKLRRASAFGDRQRHELPHHLRRQPPVRIVAELPRLLLADDPHHVSDLLARKEAGIGERDAEGDHYLTRAKHKLAAIERFR